MTTLTHELTTGRLEMDVLTLSQLHHGAGMSGNTQILRREKVIDPDGRIRRVPVISGGSVKTRLIRQPGVLHALAVMGVEAGSLDKRVVDLLFSGGHLSASGSSSVKLERARALSRLFPVLALCGYSAGNRMEESMVSVGSLKLVCAENRHRLSPQMAGLPHAQLGQGHQVETSLGTRMEATRSPHVSRLLTDGELGRLDKAVSAGAGKAHTDSSQMIFETEVVSPGARFQGTIHFYGLTPLHLAALTAALSYGCHGTTDEGRLIYRLGAKGAVGYGQVGIFWSTQIHVAPRAPEAYAVEGLIRAKDAARPPELQAYEDHLRGEREAILEALREAAK